MAPVKKPQPSTRTKGRKPSGSSAGASKSKSSSSSSRPKPKSRSKDVVKRPPPKQIKTKALNVADLAKPKKHKYTDAQLNLPAINAIVPANAAARTGRGTGKKKDKVYVDDTESMMTILAMVNAEKEGQIESKVLKARRLEEIRDARLKEAEKRAESRKGKFEELKADIKRSGKRKGGDGEGKREGEMNGKRGLKTKRDEDAIGGGAGGGDRKKKRKSVSFA